MREFQETINEWVDNDHSIVCTRVIKTWGSSPRPVGSMLLVNEAGEMAGSVSGGCVEGSVVKESLNVIENGAPKKLHYGVSDEEAWSVGLSCGGKISLLTQPFKLGYDGKDLFEIWRKLDQQLSDNKGSILISALMNDQTLHNSLILDDHTVIGDPVSDTLKTEALQAYDQRQNKMVDVEGVPYFLQVFPRKSQLIIIGAAHITVDLVALANQFDFETIVIDPRGAFAKKTVFYSQPAKVIESYPSEALEDIPLDAYTFCAILSHDPKIDDNALEVLLPSQVAYIGALGGHKTHAKRIKRLKENGWDDEILGKIHAPIGVDINAKSAKEIALSVISEIIGIKNKYL